MQHRLLLTSLAELDHMSTPSPCHPSEVGDPQGAKWRDLRKGTRR